MDADVVVVGDGPAGAALASACVRAGLSTLLVGPADPWTATYATWRDDVPDLPDDVMAATATRMVAVGHREHVIDRPYGVLDGERLAAHLTAGVERVTTTVDSVTHHAWGSRAALAGGRHVDAAVVVDATGRGLHREPGGPRAWQTAFGVVLAEPPARLARPDGAGTLMNWRPPPGAPDIGVPTFAYVVPVADGWLVEETVLAANPAVPPDALEQRLAARLGTDVAEVRAAARRVERVRIAMGVSPPTAGGGDVRFGAAAGYVHPATGYSVAASLRAAPRVAGAVANALASGRRGPDLAAIAQRAVWPAPARRARALHDFGLTALTGLDGDEVQSFFDAFFDLPVERWRDYLRVDTTPSDVAGVMTAVFRAAPTRVRRRLALGDPRPLLRALAR
jgi:lycopene beta-cyclase